MTQKPNLTVLKTERQEIHEDVLERAEQLVEMVREGKISSFAVAYVREDRVTINTGYTEVDGCGALLGAIALLQHRLCKATEIDD